MDTLNAYLKSLSQDAATSFKDGWALLRKQGPGQIQFWFIALLVGIAAGTTALFFRKGIEGLEGTLYGLDEGQSLIRAAQNLPWYWLIALPAVGGLLVGLILHNFTPDGRVRSVADVIEGAAMNEGRVETRAGVASAIASFITLSSGGSTGREGPVVHLAAVIATKVSRYIHADGITGRDLLGCAVAAAVSTDCHRVCGRHGHQPFGIRRRDRIHVASRKRVAVLRGTACVLVVGPDLWVGRGGADAHGLLG